MVMDRQLPLYLPFMEAESSAGGHSSRYNMEGKRYAVISTCGFYTSEGNYDAVNARFDRIYGKGNYTALHCGQSDLFHVPELKERTEQYDDLLSVSYLAFGLMWMVTIFQKVPITAWYSMNDYGEEAALQNPIFLQTNRILTVCWGGLYLLISVWTYVLQKNAFASVIGVLNMILPALLGLFTVWFIKWYPRHYAAKRSYECMDSTEKVST